MAGGLAISAGAAQARTAARPAASVQPQAGMCHTCHKQIPKDKLPVAPAFHAMESMMKAANIPTSRR